MLMLFVCALAHPLSVSTNHNMLAPQGEDVVAGIRTPDPISTLSEVMPAAYKELLANVEKLENHYTDMQDIEFTIQDEKLYMLQCRNGKRTGPAAVKIAVDMFKVSAHPVTGCLKSNMKTSADS